MHFSWLPRAQNSSKIIKKLWVSQIFCQIFLIASGLPHSMMHIDTIMTYDYQVLCMYITLLFAIVVIIIYHDMEIWYLTIWNIFHWFDFHPNLYTLRITTVQKRAFRCVQIGRYDAQHLQLICYWANAQRNQFFILHIFIIWN